MLCFRELKIGHHDRNDVAISLDCLRDLQSQPIFFVGAVVETVWRQDEDEVWRVGNATQQRLIKMAGTQIINVEEDAQVIMAQLRAQQTRCLSARASAVADKNGGLLLRLSFSCCSRLALIACFCPFALLRCGSTRC